MIHGIAKFSAVFNVKVHAIVQQVVQNYAAADFCNTKPDELFFMTQGQVVTPGGRHQWNLVNHLVELLLQLAGFVQAVRLAGFCSHNGCVPVPSQCPGLE